MNSDVQTPPGLCPGEEEQWIAAAKRGDYDAFESLVHKYERKVYALCLRLCGNPNDAQECAQETFLSVWQGLPFFRGDASFSTWLYRLTSNACMDFLRKEQRHRSAAGPSLDDEELNLDVADPGATPQSEAERKELRSAIEQGLSSLHEDYRTVLVLRELEQLSYDEIADTLELELGTVKSRISRGRKLLREFLVKNGNFFADSPSKKAEREGCK
ncbi:MAG: sigma-70 family RNA polymerase sigma factor [Oscillibacter sp.]|jgi:RNA polymerase sigma-70 factor (ECF subfamily)|nr:sigma-70 family RNA polymerase sigma factor [Oscillibacter sp.]